MDAQKSPRLIVALSGGIACGKSTIAQEFEALGVEIIDTDLIAREMVTKGTPALKAIQQHFSQNIITSTGELDRKALRKVIFNDPKERLWLEALLHPLIRDEVHRREAKVKSPYCILVIPLLKDRTQYPEVSFIIMADCSEETQIQRVMARDSISRSDAKKIIEAQLPRTDRLKLADAVIDTDSEKTVKEHIKKLHSQFLHRSSNSTS